MNSLLLFLGLVAPPSMVGPVAAHAAYVIHTQAPEQTKCCGACKGGVVTHGDGHKTPCPCPPDCLCKAVRHPPAVLCPDGKCTSKK